MAGVAGVGFSACWMSENTASVSRCGCHVVLIVQLDERCQLEIRADGTIRTVPPPFPLPARIEQVRVVRVYRCASR